MGQVALTVNGRRYQVGCQDGDEERLQRLAAHLEGHADALRERLGASASQERMLLMIALMVADEFFDATSAPAEAAGDDDSVDEGRRSARSGADGGGGSGSGGLMTLSDADGDPAAA